MSGSNSDLAIVRYNANGSPDTSFGTGGTGKVTASRSTAEGWGAIDLEVSGDILVAGYETNGSGNKDFLIARYLPDGTLDTSFGTSGFVETDFAGGDDYARAVLEQPDGSVVVAGDATVGGTHVLAVAKYTAAGALDTSFDTDGKVTLAAGTGDAYGYGLALQPDGKLVAVGYASGSGTGTDMVAARFNANGSLDSGVSGDTDPADSFGTAGVATVDFAAANDHAYAVALAPDGSVVLAGDATTGGSAFSAVAKLTPAGVLDATFNAAGTVPGTLTRLTAGSVANAVAVDGLGRAVVAGAVVRSGGTDHDFVVYRLNADGSADTAFGASGTVQTNYPTNKDDAAYAVAVTATAVVVAGTSGGDFAVARYVPGGSAVQRLYALQDANYNVTALADASGTIVERFEYDPYGKSSVMTGGWGSTTDAYDWSYRHQGGKLEAATGVYAFRRRDYDPALGRWLEEDPLEYPDGLNRFQYLMDAPSDNLDPWGLRSQTAEEAAILAKLQQLAAAAGPDPSSGATGPQIQGQINAFQKDLADQIAASDGQEDSDSLSTTLEALKAWNSQNPKSPNNNFGDKGRGTNSNGLASGIGKNKCNLFVVEIVYLALGVAPKSTPSRGTANAMNPPSAKELIEDSNAHLVNRDSVPMGTVIGEYTDHGHVGIYLGAGLYISASSRGAIAGGTIQPNDGVIIKPVTKMLGPNDTLLVIPFRSLRKKCPTLPKNGA